MQFIKSKQLNHTSARVKSYILTTARRAYKISVLQSYACDVIINIDGVIIPLTHHAYGATTCKHCATFCGLYANERRERVATLRKYKAYREACEAVQAGGYIPRDNIEQLNDGVIIKLYNIAKKLNY